MNKNLNIYLEETRKKIYNSFSDIEFLEKDHQYFINGEEYVSVSSIIDKFCEPFDKDAISKNCAKKRGVSQEELLQEWKYINRKSTVNGSLTHEFGESAIWLRCGHPELMPEDVKRRQYIENENWLIPYSKKEEAAMSFLNDLPDSILPVGAEFKMSSKFTNLSTKFCGTTDILFYYDNPKNPGFIIGDWKTNAELKKEYARKKKKVMLAPFDDLIDEPLSHYTLQFSMYQIMLESIGLNILGRRLIWLKDDGSYDVIKIKDVTNKLKKIL